MTPRLTLMATVAALGLGSLSAMAAPPPPPAASGPATAGPAANGPATGPAMPATAPQTMTARMDQRIAALHAALLITPAQAPQWKQFTAVMRENAQAMDNNMRQRLKQLPNMTAEQNMRSYMHIATAHARAMRRLLPAFEHLYTTMSASQKATADELFRNDAYRGKPTQRG